MACLFDKALCDRVREAARTQEIGRIETRDGYVTFADGWVCPKRQEVGSAIVPIWCSCCGAELDGPAVRFWFQFNNPLIGLTDHWLHQESCRGEPIKLDK